MANIDHISSANYQPLLNTISKFIERWKSLPISLIGRVNTIKMSILPKILYLFQKKTFEFEDEAKFVFRETCKYLLLLTKD